MSTTLSTHVLDATSGARAAGVAVRLESRDGEVLARAETDADGRIAELAPAGLVAGVHRLVFDTGAYFTDRGVEHFHPEVVVTFRIDDPERGHHVPLLLSPFAYSTYRGS